MVPAPAPVYCWPVADTRHPGTLARTHEGQPGLPRGRSGLPLRAVRASQRERLLRSVIAAVSDIGYPGVTVADIVRRARVSRAAFYAHFADKEECFLAATGEGREIMFGRLVAQRRYSSGQLRWSRIWRLIRASIAAMPRSRSGLTRSCRPS